MATSANKDRIRESWQPRQVGGAPAKAWLIVRRIVATLVALALIGACGWLLVRMLSHTDTYFSYWTATTYEPLIGQPLAHAYGDYEAIKLLNPLKPLVEEASADFTDPLQEPLTKESLAKRLTGLATGTLDDKETLILCITAHGVVDKDQKACLLCEPGGTDSYYQVSELLEQLKKVPVKTKLLILDAGRDNNRSSFELPAKTFAALLEGEVKASNDPNLWLLSANAPRERSHTSPSLRRSVFGNMLSEGLSEKADKNSDGYIELDEFYQHVQNGVSQWVKLASSEHETQTPILLHADPAKLVPDQLADCILLSASPAGTAEENTPGEDQSGISPKDIPATQVEEALDKVTTKVDALSESIGGSDEGQVESTDVGKGSSTLAKGDRVGDDKAEAGNDHRVRAQNRLDKAFQQLSDLEKFSNERHPSMAEPWQWRELVERLLWCEQFCNVGIPQNHREKWSLVIGELDSINDKLSAYIQNNAIPVPDSLIVDQPLNDYPSLAMAELIANHRPNDAQAKEITGFAKSYDAWLADKNSSLATLDAILPENKDKPKDTVPIESRKTFYELQLLTVLRDPEAEVPWNLVRLVLNTRRIGEKTAANLLCGEGWAQDKVILADQARLEGERLILDRTNSNWVEVAQDKLADSGSLYAQAESELETIRQIQQRRNLLLRRASDYVRWAQFSGGDRYASHDNTVAIKSLFTLLRSINQMLAAASPQNFNHLVQLDAQVQKAQQVVESRLNPAGKFFQIANLLDTPLPVPTSRKKLHKELVESEKQLMKPFEANAASIVPRSPKSPDQLKEELKEQLELEFALAKLGGQDEESDLDKVEEAFEKLSALSVELPKSIASLANSIDLKNAEDRPARLAQLRGALCDWLLLGGQSAGKLDNKNNLAAVLDRAAWYDLVRWQFDRFCRSEIDAPQFEMEFLRNASQAYLQLANSIPEQPSLNALSQLQLTIDPQDNIALVNSAFEEFSLSVNSQSSEAKPIWIIAQYNPEWLEVSGPSVHLQHDLPLELSATNQNERMPDYPARFKERGLVATAQLSANGTAQVPLRVSRLPSKDAGGSTKLILKAISHDAFVRREFNVTLPGRELLELRVDAESEYWESTRPCETCPADGIKLYPLPNHVQPFAFNLVNHARVKKQLRVEFLIPDPERWPDGVIFLPPGAQPEATVDELLRPFMPLHKLSNKPFEVTLPDTGQAVRIKLPSSDEQVDPETNLLIPDKSDPDKFKPVLLKHGLFLKLTDVQSKEVTIRRIQIIPQRPGRYLTITAGYDADTQRVDILAKANYPNSLPEEGISITAVFEGISSEKKKKLSGKLKKSSSEPELLNAHLAATAPQEVKASIHVDGYPRAFVFRIRRGASIDKIPLSTDPEVRIVSPANRTAFNASVTEVPIRLEVDAAEGAFDDEESNAIVEVGIDEKRNRELQGDEILTLFSDRQVEISATRLSPDGTLSLITRVGDFVRELPTEGLSDLRTDLLAQIVINGETTRSEPVEIVLDGRPPAVHADDVPNQVEIGEDVVIPVVATTPDDSGVAKVEAVFESIGAGDEKEPEWAVAIEDGNGGWIAKIETSKLGAVLKPIPKTILIRATDKVGNVSEPISEKILIVPKQETPTTNTPAAPPDVSNTVSGRAVYDNQPALVTLTLASTAGVTVATKNSNNAGEFSFSKVPPGEYVLNALTVNPIRNKKRSAEMKLTVLPRAQGSAPIRVSLE